MIIRPVRVSDLPAIERMAHDSGVGVTNLPDQRETLFERIRLSVRSFETDVATYGTEFYQFVLEDEGRLCGTAAIAAAAGFSEPFYSYRNETLVHASASLNVHNKIHALTLCHDLSGESQLCAFFLEPAYHRHPYAAQLLSRARLLFIAQPRERFARRLIAEMVGWTDENGISPFWEAIGRKFFHIDYAQAQHLVATRSKTFVAELMPSYPIYVSLLPDAAQHVIGQIHPDAELPWSILMAEGFEDEDYLAIFDGAPTLVARTDHVRSIAAAKSYFVRHAAPAASHTQPYLLANTATAEFRATLTTGTVDANKLYLPLETCAALGLREGETVTALPVDESLC